MTNSTSKICQDETTVVAIKGYRKSKAKNPWANFMQNSTSQSKHLLHHKEITEFHGWIHILWDINKHISCILILPAIS
jgi:hypothetical protein